MDAAAHNDFDICAIAALQPEKLGNRSINPKIGVLRLLLEIGASRKMARYEMVIR